MMKACWLLAGWIFFTIGIVGIYLPVLPTTPFLILTSYCFSKGSNRLHRWILSLPAVGPVISDWEEHGTIRLRAKTFATTIIVAFLLYLYLLLDVSIAVKTIVSCMMYLSLIYIWTRPSKARSSNGHVEPSPHHLV